MFSLLRFDRKCSALGTRALCRLGIAVSHLWCQVLKMDPVLQLKFLQGASRGHRTPYATCLRLLRRHARDASTCHNGIVLFLLVYRLWNDHDNSFLDALSKFRAWAGTQQKQWPLWQANLACKAVWGVDRGMNVIWEVTRSNTQGMHHGMHHHTVPSVKFALHFRIHLWEISLGKVKGWNPFLWRV